MNLSILFFLFLSLTSSMHAVDTTVWLKAKGKKIVDPEGKELLLRGINLGGWLAEELWMIPFKNRSKLDHYQTKLKDRNELWQLLEKRFGRERMNQIRSHFRAVWITDHDFRIIHDAGFNSVRLPFIYDLADEPTGLYFWLDYAIDAASRHGLYVVLDMHGAPGRQSHDQHTGATNQSTLFENPEMVKKTAKLWAEIAMRYKDNPAVAGYDLLNEPMCAKSNRELYQVQDEIYQAIRKIDKRHLIFIEDGYKGISNMPKPKKYKWKNVVLSSHIYTFDAKEQDDYIRNLEHHLQLAKELKKKCKAPYYLGEFNLAHDGTVATLQSFLQRPSAKNLSYALWTYKLARKEGWAFYLATRKLAKIDPFKDSFKEIMQKLETYKTSYFARNGAFVDVIKSYNAKS